MTAPSLCRWLITPRTGSDAQRAPRDVRVDAVRGFALLVIFVTHVPGNPLASYAPGAFFFHDAADAFVLLAGFAVALAFGPLFERRGFLVGTARVGGRILELYGAHLLTFIFVAGLIAWAAMRFDDPLYYEAVNIQPLFAETERALLHALLLVYQPNYLDILPLYVVLLAAFPLLPFAMRASPAAVLCGSVLLWALAQGTGLNLPNLPLNGVWFFNPLAWQLLFVIGAVAGYAVRDGVALPRGRTLLAIALLAVPGIVLLKAMQGHVPLLGFLEWLPREYHLAWDKVRLSPARIFSLLACAYLIAVLVDRDAAWLHRAPARTLAMVGRHSLEVFSIGIVCSMVAYVVLTETDRVWYAVLGVNAVGIVTLVLLAHVLAWYDRTVSQAKAVSAPASTVTAGVPS